MCKRLMSQEYCKSNTKNTIYNSPSRGRVGGGGNFLIKDVGVFIRN